MQSRRTFNDGKNTVSFEYFNLKQGKTIAFEEMKINRDDYDILKNKKQQTLYYNPFFSEDVYFDVKQAPNIGSVILVVFGIFIFYVLLRHKN